MFIKLRYQIKKQLRPIYRKFLGLIVKATVKKHQPLVVVLVGNGPTSIVREAVFAVLSEVMPARRNIELPEAEFSVPITVLDQKNYPYGFFSWVWFSIKSFVQIFTIRSFKHALVLELKPQNQNVLDYWLDILRPEIFVQLGEFKYFINKEQVKFFRNYNIDDAKAGYEHIATEIGQYLNIDELDIELALANIKLPEARLRILPGLNNSIVFDATHYYFPLKLSSVLETIETDKENCIAFTKYQKDKEVLESLGWQVNPPNYLPRADDIILIRGRRSNLLSEYSHLILRVKELSNE